MRNQANRWRALRTRLVSLLLAATFMVSLLPAVTPAAEAASWMDPYLDKMQEWGVMRGDIDGNLDGNRNITRAEFLTMVNRAYNFTETGSVPFRDMEPDDWYYEDVAIAYEAGYFAGTTNTTASPNDPLNREQAVSLLGRVMLLQGGTGETLTFTDSRDFSSWSRHMIEAGAQEGFISGFPDGSFRAKEYMTRGQVASMMVRAVGNPVQDSGTQTLGSVDGNVTITAPGVTLKDTTINGDLYISGGVGLSNVVLENVDVLGKIVVSGAGESEEGEHSVVLRNVDAEQLVMDSMTNQFVTLRAEGDTDIDNVSARTQVYLEDMTDDGRGLRNILLEAEEGTPFQLAGNIKNVRNETSGSTLTIAQGITNTVTVDEAALDTTIDIKNDAIVNTINLDAGVNVIGQGDISHLNVNAPGSTVEMLPDTITVRPGITADIYEEEMDSVAAIESSEIPRLLAGYPKTQNVAPSSAESLFKTNKKGTIYWGLTALNDGSLEEEELINPPAYSGKIIKSGTMEADASDTELLNKLSGLTSDGSYYVSAVLVDNRGMRSPVKVAAFTTPDDTVPNFVSGYPVMSLITNEDAQVTVMANKTCQLYWAVFPKGSTAPKAADFKSGALEGNLGSGNMQVTKNSTMPFYVNSPSGNLVEQETYDLYLWLTDFDGAKSSAVKKLSFTTVDKTPPIVTSIYQSNAAAKTATITFSINEPATLYWGVVLAGEEFFRPVSNSTEEPDPASKEAKVQVEAGTNAVKKGNKSVSKEGVETTFTISGLETETAYDLYYVAKDKAGNYSEKVLVLEGVKTQDTNSPLVEQSFSLYKEDSSGNTNPMPETDISLNFNEVVWGTYTEKGVRKYDDFALLYSKVQEAEDGSKEQDAAKDDLAAVLKKYIELWERTSTGRKQVMDKQTAEQNGSDDWVIDYREAVVTTVAGKTVITFPTNQENSTESGLNLSSGGTYYFIVSSICDTSGNTMASELTLPEFTTVFAIVNLSDGEIVQIDEKEITNAPDEELTADAKENKYLRVDMSFTMTPESTTRVPDGILWDMLLWTDTTMEYSVYYREADSNDNWTRVPKTISANVADADKGRVYASWYQYILAQTTFGELNKFTKGLEIAVHVRTINSDNNFEAWNKEVAMGVTVLAGGVTAMRLAGLSGGLGQDSNVESAKKTGAVSIGVDDPFEIIIPFTDSVAPKFVAPTPRFVTTDASVTLQVTIDRPGTVYYVIAPVSNVDENDPEKYDCPVVPSLSGALPSLDKIPLSGEKDQEPMELSQPYVTTVTNGVKGTAGVFSGNTKNIAENLEAGVQQNITVNDLTPDTTYLVYMATKGISSIFSEHTMVYQFRTEPAERPFITMTNLSPNVQIEVNKTSTLSYILVLTGKEDVMFTRDFKELFPGDYKPLKDYEEYFVKGASVLKAMSEVSTLDGVTGTIFDLFVTDQNVRDLYERAIQASTVDGSQIVMKGTANFNMDEEKLIECQNMQGDNRYTMIATAATTTSEPAFRAIWPVYNRDVIPPYITVDPSIVARNSTDNKVWGTFALTFSEPMYIRKTGDTSQDFTRIDACDSSHSNNDTDAIAFGKCINMPSDKSIIYNPVTDNCGEECLRFEFSLDGAIVGSQISFNYVLCDSAGNTQSKTLVLTLAREKIVDGEDVSYKYYWEYPVEWSAERNETE